MKYVWIIGRMDDVIKVNGYGLRMAEVVLYTNIRIFGLRQQPDRAACYQVLENLNRLYSIGD